MKPEEIIDELRISGTLTKLTIKEIEENRTLRHELLQYFVKNKNRDFILNFLNVLTELRRDPHNAGISGDSLMLACFLLGKHGQIEDCMKIWETKRIDFDTYCYVDIQLVVFAGVQKTIEYMESHTSNEARQALEYVIACSEAGDFDDLEQYFSREPWYV